MKLRKSLAILGMVCLMFSTIAFSHLSFGNMCAYAANGIALNSQNFPDKLFRSNLSWLADKDQNGTLSSSEIKAVTNMDFFGNYFDGQAYVIANCKGLEYFTELKDLNLYRNALQSLDISKNTKLEMLDCSSNPISSLDVSKNPNLKILCCYNTIITKIDISHNKYLLKAYNSPTSTVVNDTYTTYEYSKGTEKYCFAVNNSVKVITKSTTHTHTWDSGKVTKAATYGATGVKTYTCKICGAKKTSSIAKKTVKKLTAKTTYTCTTNAVRINWNKLSGVTGYKVFRYDGANKKWVAVKAIYDPNTTDYKISGLKAGTVYKFRVNAFVKENGKFYFGESCSTISTATRPNTTTVTKANKTSTAVRLFWNKKTCTGYRILRYDSATKKWVRVTAVGSSSTTQLKISGLKKNTTYKFKVQPYVKVGSKVIDGAASKEFTVKTTK